MWSQFISEEQTEESPVQVDLENLAGQFTLTSSQIRDAVAAARDAAQKRWQDQVDQASDSQEARVASRQAAQPTREELFAAARAYSNPRLIDLARKITHGGLRRGDDSGYEFALQFG